MSAISQPARMHAVQPKFGAIHLVNNNPEAKSANSSPNPIRVILENDDDASIYYHERFQPTEKLGILDPNDHAYAVGQVVHSANALLRNQDEPLRLSTMSRDLLSQKGPVGGRTPEGFKGEVLGPIFDQAYTQGYKNGRGDLQEGLLERGLAFLSQIARKDYIGKSDMSPGHSDIADAPTKIKDVVFRQQDVEDYELVGHNKFAVLDLEV